MEMLGRTLPRLGHACRSCRRNFSTTASRSDLLAGLESRMAASVSPRPAGQPSQTRTNSAPSSSLREAVRAARQQSRTPSGPRPQDGQTMRGGVIASSAQYLRETGPNKEMEAQMLREWSSGDVYSTHDLGPREAAKWALTKKKPSRDIFEMIGQDPRKFYKNPTLLSHFVLETGRIKGAASTGLKLKNQRRLAKAVRRAVACGMMPSVYKHPELIRQQLGGGSLAGGRYSGRFSR